jgi:hypothetical protein
LHKILHFCVVVKDSERFCAGDGKTIFKTLNDGEFFGELALLNSQVSEVEEF